MPSAIFHRHRGIRELTSLSSGDHCRSHDKAANAKLSASLSSGLPSVSESPKGLLRDCVVIFDGPLGVTSGATNGWCPQGGVAHTEHAELGGQSVQIEANAVEVGIGGASGQRGGDCVLRGCVLLSQRSHDPRHAGAL
jgi:hypothetical protein